MDRKNILVLIAIIGFFIIMFQKNSIKYIISWIILIAVIAFIWVPSINKISTKYFSLSKKVEEVMVQYNEFKETIYPLLEIELANIASTSYLGVSTKSAELMDFIYRVEKFKINLNSDEKMRLLIYAAKTEVINSFSAELAEIRQRNGIKTNMSNYIDIKRNDYSDEQYVKEKAISINKDRLLASINDFGENYSEKELYLKKINDLISFYENNFK